MITVSIISPKVSLQAINRVIEQNDFGCIFHKYVYHTLEEIQDIYYKCKDHCDIIFWTLSRLTRISRSIGFTVTF